MTSEGFTKALKEQASDAAIRITLQNLRRAPGKRPIADLVMRSNWFAKLSLNDQEMIGEVVREAAKSAVFGVLAVLDGSRAVEDSQEKGSFELFYVKG
jgi:hypothetical protein